MILFGIESCMSHTKNELPAIQCMWDLQVGHVNYYADLIWWHEFVNLKTPFVAFLKMYHVKRKKDIALSIFHI